MSDHSLEQLLNPTIMEDIPEVDEHTAQKLRQLVTQLQALENTPGWGYLVTVLKSQAQRRYDAVGRMQAFEVRDMVEQAGMRGEASALELLADMPTYLIGEMQAQLISMGSEIEEEEHDEDAG